MTPALPAAAYLAALALATAGLASQECRRRLGAEARRKALHVTMGSLAVPFPWVFAGPGPVLALAAAATGILLALRLVPALRTRFGPALHGVERGSAGDFAFAAGVALAFVLAAGVAWLYVVPLLLLTLADPAAALVGGRWGARRWPWAGGAKTLAGSAAFAAVAFVVVAAALLVSADVPPVRAVTVALAVAVGTALVESAAGGGSDNLLVPLAGSLLLAFLPGARPVVLLVAVAGSLLLVAGAAAAARDARPAEVRA